MGYGESSDGGLVSCDHSWVSKSIWVAIISYHRQGGLKNRDLLLTV